MGIGYGAWDASQCALLIGWKKGLTCPSPVEHTNQYNSTSTQCAYTCSFTHHRSQDGNETLCITITIKNHKTSKEWALSVYVYCILCIVYVGCCWDEEQFKE